MIRSLVAGLGLAAVALGLAAGSAGAVALPAPPLTDHALIVTFVVQGADQIVEAVEDAPPTDLAAYQRMEALRDKLVLGCGTHQLDHFPPGVPVPVVGQVYPPDTPGAISAIPNIVGTGSCDETPPPTTEPAPTTSTAPPVLDATTTIPTAPSTTEPATVDTFTPTTAAPAAPAQAVELAQAQAVARSAALPTTGAHSVPVALFGFTLMVLGTAVVVVARSGRLAR